MSIKVENSSDYWRYDDEQDHVWYFHWRASAYDFLYIHREAFVSHYLHLVEAYGFMLPLCFFYEARTAETKSTFLADFFERVKQATREEDWLPLYQLYICDRNRTGDQSFPSLIFNHPMEPPRPLVDMIKNKAVSDLDRGGDAAVFLRSWSQKAEKRFGISMHVQHDAFNLILKNKNTERRATPDIAEQGVDNFDLSILNAPRFNSFFREFRRLADHFGAEVISEGKADFTLDGFLYDGVASTYEDWVDELPEHGRIVTAKSLQNLATLVPKYNKPKELDPEVFSASEINEIKRTEARKTPWEWDPDYLSKTQHRRDQGQVEPKRNVHTAAQGTFLEDPVANTEKVLCQNPKGNPSNQKKPKRTSTGVNESDIYDLAVDTILGTNHRSLSQPYLNQWAQFTKKIVAPAFDLDTAGYKAYLKALPIPFVRLTIEPDDIQASFEAINEVIELDDDILCTLAVIMSDKKFFKRLQFFQNASEWVQSKKWAICLGYDFVTNLSLRQIAATPNGQIFLRKKIIESPILSVK